MFKFKLKTKRNILSIISSIGLLTFVVSGFMVEKYHWMFYVSVLSFIVAFWFSYWSVILNSKEDK